MDLKPNSCGQNCGSQTDAQIARHFDAKVAERLTKGQDSGLVAVSQRLRDVLLDLRRYGVEADRPPPAVASAVPAKAMTRGQRAPGCRAN